MRAAKDPASLRICSDSPESSLLDNTIYVTAILTSVGDWSKSNSYVNMYLKYNLME